MKLDKKNVMKCSLEKVKFAILPSIHIPAETSPQPNPVVQITVACSWPPVSKQNSDTQQIGDVKKIQKELFPNDDVDDNILVTAAAKAESALLSEKKKNYIVTCVTFTYIPDIVAFSMDRSTMCCVFR